MIAGVFLLLVRGFVLFIDDDDAEILQRGKNRAPGSDDEKERLRRQLEDAKSSATASNAK